MAKAKRYSKFHCSKCNRETKHIIVTSYLFKESIILSDKLPAGELTVDNDYKIVQCAGCDNVSFIHELPAVDFYVQYPEQVKKHRGLFLERTELPKLPNSVLPLYQEVMIAFKNNAPILSGIGLRALVEAICLQQKIQGYNLHLKIKELHTRGLISKQELPILDKLRTIGNAAAHKIKAVDEDSLRHALLIINHVLRSVYILPGFSKKIKL